MHQTQNVADTVSETTLFIVCARVPFLSLYFPANECRFHPLSHPSTYLLGPKAGCAGARLCDETNALAQICDTCEMNVRSVARGTASEASS